MSMEKIKKFIFGAPAPATDVVRAIVNEAWIDNCDDRLYFATGHARKRFNEVVGGYVIDHFARTGKLPEGNHHVSLGGRRMIYFAPRWRAQASGRFSAEPSSAS